MTTKAEELSEAYIREVGTIVRRLRTAAEDIERRDIPTDMGDLKASHLGHARRTLHTALAVLPNLGLDGLVRLAEQADKAARDG